MTCRAPLVLFVYSGLATPLLFACDSVSDTEQIDGIIVVAALLGAAKNLSFDRRGRSHNRSPPPMLLTAVDGDRTLRLAPQEGNHAVIPLHIG